MGYRRNCQRKKRSRDFLVIATLSLILSLFLRGSLRAESDADFQFNVFGWLYLNDAQRAQAIERLKSCRAEWVRIPFPWQFIETKKGLYDFAKFDAEINTFYNNGIRPLLMVSTSPEWAARDKKVKANATPPADPQDFANFLSQAAKRYKGKLIAYEIWNEPDNPPYWGRKKSTPKEYLDLLKPAYLAIKKADPQATVVGGCVLVQFMSEPDFTYLQGLLEQGVMDYCDVISIHIYPHETQQAADEFRQCLRTAERMVRQYSNKEIWVTETGMYSKRFSEKELFRLLKLRGFTDRKIRLMFQRPLCKFAFLPLKVPEVYNLKLQKKEAIQRALAPFGLTFNDAMRLSQEAWLDAQEEQANFLEEVFRLSREHKIFWFQLYDVVLPAGILDEQFRPKAAYGRLLELEKQER